MSKPALSFALRARCEPWGPWSADCRAWADEAAALEAEVAQARAATVILAELHIDCDALTAENTALRARHAAAVQLLRKDLGYADPREVLPILEPEEEFPQ